MSSWILNISKSGDSATSLDNLSNHFNSKKKGFTTFRHNFLCFSLCPLSIVLLQSTAERLSFLHPPSSYLYTLRFHPHPQAFSFPFSVLSAFPHSLERCVKPLTIFTALHWAFCRISMFRLYWKAQPTHSIPAVASPVVSRVEWWMPAPLMSWQQF